jgi:hypothetical protein
VLSWVGYGLTLANAAVLLAVSFEEGDVSSAHIASVGLVGTLSLIGFSIDASASASQAERLSGPAATLEPRVGLQREGDGSLSPTVGVAGTFK